MRAMRKVSDKWTRETPENLSAWMWKNDGEEAVVVDDATHTYYCGTPSMLDTYREAWERERKPNDQRRAAMFITLDKLLFQQEGV